MKDVDKIDFLNNVISLLPNCFSLDVKRFIACHFAYESVFGTSAFAKYTNNYCGMKVPYLRVTLARNFTEYGKFACYSGFTYCIHDYLLWLTYNKFTRNECFDLLAFSRHFDVSGYCLDCDYISNIQTIFSNFYNYECTKETNLD